MKKVEYGQTGFHEQSWGNQKVHEWAEATMSCVRILEKKISLWMEFEGHICLEE